MIIYKIEPNGQCTNLQFSKTPREGYESMEGDRLPDIETLHTDAYKAILVQEQTNAAARQYLAETDWYAARLIDTGEPIPADIKAERAKRRLEVI